MLFLRLSSEILLENRHIKFLKTGIYILSVFPTVFIISSLIFYIYYGLFLNFWGISGINPNEHPAIEIYSHLILYSGIISLLCIAIFVFIVGLTTYLKAFKQIKLIILINLMVYLIAISIMFSKVFEFAMD